MHPRIHQDEGRLTPAQRCSRYDFGGGVRFGDTFAIYSVVAFPPNWNSINHHPKVHNELEDALSSVTAILPIHTVLSGSAWMEIGSLPSRRRHATTTPCSHLPLFLMNAARFKKHCVLGHHTAMESLLRILQRPWCVLELCCCETPIVAAVRGFANAASRIDRAYDPAAQVLSYELAKRSDDSASHSAVCQTPNHCWPKVCAIYAALSPSRLLSHESFWIGLLCACAVYLGVSFSNLTTMLWDPPSASLSRGILQTTSTRLGPSGLPLTVACRSSSRPVRHAARLRRWKSDSDIRGNSPVNKGPHGGQPQPDCGNVAYLLHLYKALVRAMGEMI